MNNADLYKKMCADSSAHTIQNEPDTTMLFYLVVRKFKTAREAILDITEWLEVNQYAHDWSLDMILLGYYMRTQYATCWDTNKEEWVKIEDVLDKKVDEAEATMAEQESLAAEAEAEAQHQEEERDREEEDEYETQHGC